MVLGPPKTGGDCYAYYNSATYAAPTWVEIDEVSDVNIVEFDTAMAEVVTRAGAYATNFAAKRRAAVEMTYLYGANPTVFDFLRAAAENRTVVDLLILDGIASQDGSEGLRMQGLIESFPINQPIEDASQVDTIRFVNAYALDAGDNRIDPAWVVMATGQPTAAQQAMVTQGVLQVMQTPKKMLAGQANLPQGVIIPEKLPVYVSGGATPPPPKKE